ncbi:MAG: DUF2231 domain-containing protein [Candidatus Omnitrophica bacterium]|nr:DUF2231 domain-containing protein [Candidatus Omnitrophota bacterium]
MQSIHPLVVHFPIALLLAAVGLEMVAMAAKRPGLHTISLWNLWLGTLGAAAAVLTGWQAEELASHSMAIHEVMAWHERLGLTTLGLAACITAVRLWRRDQCSARLRTATLVMLALLTVSVAVGAHLGGRLVYEFGVGSAVLKPPGGIQVLP